MMTTDDAVTVESNDVQRYVTFTGEAELERDDGDGRYREPINRLTFSGRGFADLLNDIAIAQDWLKEWQYECSRLGRIRVTVEKVDECAG